MQGGIKVTGLKELRAELKKLDDAGLTKELTDVNYEVANQVVLKAKAKASSVSRQAAAASRSLRASRTASRAQVLIGSASVPFALGAEFGSVRWRQFLAWRGSGEDAGYFLWPTIRDQREWIVETYGDAVEQITKKAFPD